MDTNKLQLYCNLVEEFYQAPDTQRIREIDEILRTTRKQLSTPELIALSFELFNKDRSPTLQLHGGVSLYEAILRRQNSFIIDATLCSNVRFFLIKLLKERFSIQMQAISDKQISTLALLVLQTMPDIWENPFLDLSREFEEIPGLVLKILSEIAYQYRNFNAPVEQRTKLKAILVRHTTDVTGYIIEMLRGVSSTSKFAYENIAECMANWMELPEINLSDWNDLIIEYLLQVQTDSNALSSLFKSLARNKEFPRLERFVIEICKHIVTIIRQKISNEIMQGDSSSDDLMELIDSITRLSQELSSNLIKMAMKKDTEYLLSGICELLSDISSYPAIYSVEETLSDIPTPFFTSLREDLCNLNGELGDNTYVKTLVQENYIKMLKSGIIKVAWPRLEVYRRMDHLQIEEFTKYRESRCDTALNCFFVVGDETFSFMNQTIEECIRNEEWERLESSIFFLQSSTDLLSEKHFPHLTTFFTICKTITNIPNDERGDRLGVTMMMFFYELAHLIDEHDESTNLETIIYEFCVSFLQRTKTIDNAFRTLVQYASKRSEGLRMCGDVLLNYCYDLFINQTLNEPLKLEALKVIGYILSIRHSDNIIDGVIGILSPVVSALQDRTISEEMRIFKVKMFSSLFSSIQQKNALLEVQDTPLSILLTRFYPFFLELIKNEGHGKITDEIVITMRMALLHLTDLQVPAFLPSYYELLNTTLAYNSKSALELAGTLVLVLSKNQQEITRFIHQLSLWAKSLVISYCNDPDPDLDDWISLFCKIIRKEWSALRAPLTSNDGSSFIDSCVQIATKVLQTTLNVYSVRLCAQILATITSKCTSTNDEVIRLLISEKGMQILQITSTRLSTETTKHNIDLFAEILVYFAKFHPNETRRCLEAYESQLINSLFQNIGHLHTFKILLNKLNQEIRKRQLKEE